ncbi:helix-turn-helix domain-containing protein [Massilia sp. DJPM01]|uniref:helix-turn-helix domain-containing protein n=1 Tax=Massilia sp. DJPM01 TaxID=3024404 RepID=UPI00259F039B|nr:helix-turn-helix domain-containing protein [Massilia sp. DJPM01]MDM5180264.1 helix-turn-helix domain-containing protein [Massilia sp. DJPM01]
MISSQLLFLFSALGAVNGLFLACYLFSRRSHRLANCMLGALLLAIGIRTVKSVIYYFNPDLALGFLQTGISACVFIGPLTYLYVHCCLADLTHGTVSIRWHGHLVLPSLAVGLGLIFPYSAYPYLWRCSLYGIHPYWLAYLFLAGRQLWQARALARQSLLVHSVYLSSFLILIAYVSTPLTSYIVGALSFTFSIHVTILMYFLQSETKADTSKRESYKNSKLTEDDARALLGSLNDVMRDQQLYLNPNLSLALLSKKVGNLQTTVSQVINDNLGKSFNHYINEFRIQHAQHLLVSESHLNMELVAERSGFNSNSTFFAAFKRITGQTPARYRAELAS